MPVITSLTGAAMPVRLAPPNGRLVPVEVSGRVSSNLPQRPSVTFRVIDEYRRVDRVGTLKLRRTAAIPKLNYYEYTYSKRIPLPASVSSSDSSGRSYYILISAGDQENGQGKYLPVLVPLNGTRAAARRRPG
jgi:hypothetical protein